MKSFGKRLRECRDESGLSQYKLAKLLSTSHSVIGRYERDEMTPSIDVAKKIASLLNTTVGYLLGEIEDADTFKDPTMLKRLKDLNTLPDFDKKHILYALDSLLRDAKTRQAYNS